MKYCLLFCLLLCSSEFISSSERRRLEFKGYAQDIPGSDLSIKMVPVSGGTFMMGSPENEPGHQPDEDPLHKVRISPFWMSTYEITWDLYELYLQREIDEVTATNESGSKIDIKIDAVSAATKPYLDMSFGMGKNGFPATNITQFAAATFCKWLTAKTGRFYRLPTEAEWEYACRAGTRTAYSFGDNESDLEDYGWYEGNSDGKYHQPGQKKPNAWGLYDMHGNVAEWTLDAYVEAGYTADASAEDPWVVAEDLYPRVLRGGSWYDSPEKLRSASRTASTSEWKRIDPQLPKSLWWHTNAPFIGFRIVRPVDVPANDEMENFWLKPIKEY